MSNGNEKDIEALRGNIEETRQRISGEIEAIGDRLTPGHARDVARGKAIEAKDRAVHSMRSSARNAADIATRTGSELPRAVRDNPIPVAMVLAGTGWVVWNAISRARARREPQLELELGPQPIEGRPHYEGTRERIGSRYQGARERMGSRYQDARERVGSRYQDARHRVGAMTSSARERVGGATRSARDRISGTATNAKERAGHLAHRGREGATQAWGRSQSAFDQNPLAFGAVCVFAGIGLGMLLPHTEREDRVLGGRRERVVERARHMAQEAKEVAIDSAKEGMKAARETAKHEAEERDLTHR